MRLDDAARNDHDVRVGVLEHRRGGRRRLEGQSQHPPLQPGPLQRAAAAAPGRGRRRLHARLLRSTLPAAGQIQGCCHRQESGRWWCGGGGRPQGAAAASAAAPGRPQPHHHRLQHADQRRAGRRHGQEGTQGLHQKCKGRQKVNVDLAQKSPQEEQE